jgi:hypothetical protein
MNPVEFPERAERSSNMPTPNASEHSSNAARHAHQGQGTPKPKFEQSDAAALSEQIDSIRTEIQNLTSTLGQVAVNQFGQAQASAQDTIRRNPMAAVGIAAAIGFLYALVRR